MKFVSVTAFKMFELFDNGLLIINNIYSVFK